MKSVSIKVSSWLFASLGVSGLASLLFFWTSAQAAELETVSGSLSNEALGLGYLAAALATGLSSVGAAYAVAHVGAAAMGVLAEKPELLGRTLILVGLAEGIAIYGLIISILILNRLV
ncbi:MAG: ATP synthase subunit C [gamma proteobacterium symbiont of Bathyaustriella thionipta]|nr:ATP synthase subunit C [gamma proteobacterium symbiont of Bathyaustriella thionipta]